MALTVTATQGGDIFDGMLLRVRVLTGAAAAAAQTGASASTGNGPVSSVSITTTQTGSIVYGAMVNDISMATAETGTTVVDNFDDATHTQWYGSFRTTLPTVTPGAITVGSTATTTDPFASCAAQEILPDGTITEDGSSPAVATTTSDTTVTTASFTPPSGSLLVAMAACDGGGSTFETCTITDSQGLTWHQLANTSLISASLYSGVWVADFSGSGPDTAAAALTVTPARSAAMTRTGHAGAAATVTPARAAAMTRTGFGAAALTITPARAAAMTRTGFAAAALTVAPSLAAVLSKNGQDTAAAALTVAPVFRAAMTHTALAGAALTVTPAFRAVLVDTTASAGTVRRGPPDDGHRWRRRLGRWL